MDFVHQLIKKGIPLLGLICFVLITSTAQAKQADIKKILVWGDSLSAAYGIPVEKGWVHLLQNKLGDGFEIINGSISGETTQGGLSRITSALKIHSPDLIILELGANDGLRGIPPQITKRNLRQMIEYSKEANAEVLLFGMKIPPNYGVVYSEMFEAQFANLASEYQLPFIPFFLESIINSLEFFQADQLHPTAEAQAIILDSIFPTIKNAIDRKTKGNTKHEAIKNPA